MEYSVAQQVHMDRNLLKTVYLIYGEQIHLHVVPDKHKSQSVKMLSETCVVNRLLIKHLQSVDKTKLCYSGTLFPCFIVEESKKQHGHIVASKTVYASHGGKGMDMNKKTRILEAKYPC